MMAFVSVKMVAVYRRQTVAASWSVVCRNPPSSSTDHTHACHRGVACEAPPVSPETCRHMTACQNRGTAPPEGSTPCRSCTCLCRTHTRVHGTAFVSDGGARNRWGPSPVSLDLPLRGARASRSPRSRDSPRAKSLRSDEVLRVSRPPRHRDSSRPYDREALRSGETLHASQSPRSWDSPRPDTLLSGEALRARRAQGVRNPDLDICELCLDVSIEASSRPARGIWKTHAHARTHAYVYTCHDNDVTIDIDIMYLYLYLCLHVYIYLYLHLYLCVYMYICTDIDINTQI